MKTKFIHSLYQFVSFLADKAKGFSLFSRWKIALGSLLVGNSVTTSCKQKTAYYEMAPVDPLMASKNPLITSPQCQ